MANPLNISANGVAAPVPHTERAVSVQARSLSCISGSKATLYLAPYTVYPLGAETPSAEMRRGDSGWFSNQSDDNKSRRSPIAVQAANG